MNASDSVSSRATPSRARSFLLRPRALALGLIALAALAVPARAVPFAVDRLAVGDGQLTRDTVSGLDWLDVTLTVGQSQAGAAGLTGSGGLYEGFRMATVAEFQGLFGNAGVPAGTSSSLAHISANFALHSLLGVTYSDSVAIGTWGWLSGEQWPGSGYAARLMVETYAPGSGTTASFADLFSQPNGGPISYYGLFLVRDTPMGGQASSVPDSGSTVGLLALSITGLFAVRRRLAAAVSGTDIS